MKFIKYIYVQVDLRADLNFQFKYRIAGQVYFEDINVHGYPGLGMNCEHL